MKNEWNVDFLQNTCCESWINQLPTYFYHMRTHTHTHTYIYIYIYDRYMWKVDLSNFQHISIIMSDSIQIYLFNIYIYIYSWQIISNLDILVLKTCFRLYVCFRKFWMVEINFGYCFQSKDCIDSTWSFLMPVFGSVNVSLEVIIREDLWCQ